MEGLESLDLGGRKSPFPNFPSLVCHGLECLVLSLWYVWELLIIGKLWFDLYFSIYSGKLRRLFTSSIAKVVNSLLFHKTCQYIACTSWIVLCGVSNCAKFDEIVFNLAKLFFQGFTYRDFPWAVWDYYVTCELWAISDLYLDYYVDWRGLKDSDVNSFVEDVLLNGKPRASGVPDVLAG